MARQDDAQPISPKQQTAEPLRLSEFNPQPRLVVPLTPLTHSKFPSIDIHTHFGLRLGQSKDELAQYVETMNENSIAISVSLDAKLGSEGEDHFQFLKSFDPNRFGVFCHIDFQGSGVRDDFATWDCNQDGFVHRTVEQLRAAKARGMIGLKFFKQFGLIYRDRDNRLLAIDDPKWDPIWSTCGELGMPVLIHTADPSAFFQPIDANNERWEELSRHPDWSFYGDAFPTRDALHAARNRVIARHPETTFIAAHMANDGEDLGQLANWLDELPNLYVDTASRISELGRQPYTARRFFLKYSDRVLFGTDGPWPEQRLHYYWRFFESWDEYFPYSEKPFPPQGLWRIYGIGLPDEVLQRIYFENAIRLIPALEGPYRRAVEELSEQR